MDDITQALLDGYSIRSLYAIKSAVKRLKKEQVELDSIPHVLTLTGDHQWNGYSLQTIRLTKWALSVLLRLNCRIEDFPLLDLPKIQYERKKNPSPRQYIKGNFTLPQKKTTEPTPTMRSQLLALMKEGYSANDIIKQLVGDNDDAS
jgi:hypothetical protein